MMAGRKKSASTYVYIMADGSGAMKVGVSLRPQHRKSGVSADRGVPVHVLHTTFRGPDASLIERVAHRLLKGKRETGEWFNVSQAEAEEAIRKAIEMVDSEGFDAKAYLKPERKHLPVYPSDELLARIDAWIFECATPGKIMSRAEAAREMVENFLDRHDAAKRRKEGTR
jgi:hypothetical protein